MTQVWVIDLVIQTNQYNTGLEFLRELMFIYLNNAVRKLRYFVAIISQFMFYMMLQLSLKLSPSEQKINVSMGSVALILKNIQSKNSNFWYLKKTQKRKKYLRFGSRQPITNFRGFSISIE